MDMKRKNMKTKMSVKRNAFREKWIRHTHPGIDGILVTVGLCIVALLLCVFLKEELTGFIEQIVTQMTTKAGDILKTPIPQS